MGHLRTHVSPGFCNLRLDFSIRTQGRCARICGGTPRGRNGCASIKPLLLIAVVADPSGRGMERWRRSPLPSPCHCPHHRTLPSPEGQRSARLDSPRADQWIDSQLPGRLALLHLLEGFCGVLGGFLWGAYELP